MESLAELVMEYQTLFVIIAIVAILLAALVMKRFRILAIALVLVSAFVFYVLMHGEHVLKDGMDTIKQQGQEKTIENIQ